jgi:hypothetical protein
MVVGSDEYKRFAFIKEIMRIAWANADGRIIACCHNKADSNGHG